MKCRPNKPWATVLLDTKVWGYNAVRQTAGLQCCRTSWITLLSDKKLLGHSAIGHRSVWLQDYCTKKCSVTVLSEKKKKRCVGLERYRTKKRTATALLDIQVLGFSVTGQRSAVSQCCRTKLSDSAVGHRNARLHFWAKQCSVTVLSDKDVLGYSAIGQRAIGYSAPRQRGFRLQRYQQKNVLSDR